MKFLAGGASGGLGSVVGNPFDILKTKMMAAEGVGLSLTATAAEIFKNQGVLGFYRGIDANVLRAVVNNGTKMACYDTSKSLIETYLKVDGVLLQSLASFVAGFFMTCTVAPFDICRTRLMNQPADKPKIYYTIFDTFFKIAAADGPLALWRGFIPMWARIAPTTTLQLLLFEQFSTLAGVKAT